MKLKLTAFAALALVFSIGGVSAQDADWTKPAWGADDEIGAVNLFNADLTKTAAGLVKTGKVHSLGLVLDSNVPAYPTASMSVTILQPGQFTNSGLGPTKTTYNDDIYIGWFGIGSQIDGLSHIGVNHVHHNGFKGSEFAQANGVRKLGIEKVPPIVTRGVLLDMAKHFGKDMLDTGTAYTKEAIIAAAEAQGVEIRKGDFVLFHSGWLDLLKEGARDTARYSSAEPGLGMSWAQYLSDIGVVAVGADTWALEVIPFEEGVGVFEVHQHLLAKEGVYILENMVTEELARDEADEFLFVLGHAKIKGAVQMIINPVAIR